MSEVVGLTEVDFVVVGSGPAGQKAAIAAAKAGCKVVVVEREARSGGACVRHGTIPSKTLRETALALRSLERRTAGELRVQMGDDAEVASLITRLDEVVGAHQEYIGRQLERNAVDLWQGHARFVDERTVEVTSPRGTKRRLRAKFVILATGSRPRSPEGITLDHDHVLDSDSILSMNQLPRTMAVLGAGVVASEYASIFAALGVEVTMIDKSPRPMAFLEPELTQAFLSAFSATGSRFLPERSVVSARYVRSSSCEVVLTDGAVIRADRVLCAMGRIANVDDLGLECIGVQTTSRGLVAVDAYGRTNVPYVYAVGDLTGPPALASTAMEQGRRAVRHALGIASSEAATSAIPFCAYTIPEIASVGLTEAEVTAKYGGCLVGRAPYAELARAHVSAYGDGLIKLVSGPDGRRVLGVQVVGDGASELVHVGHMAILAKFDVDVFIEATFNFPTLAEGYRVAALDVVRQRRDAATVQYERSA